MCPWTKTRNRVTSALMILLITTISSLSGQNITLKNYTTKDGLPHNNVRVMALDSTGFIWFGTWDGLSRFDGYEFKNYYHQNGDSTSLPYFSVHNLLVDKYNNLLILTDRGQLARYNSKSDDFSLIKRINDSGIDIVVNITTDENNDLWLTTNSEIIKWDTQTDQSEIFQLKDQNGNPYNMENYFIYTTIINQSEIWITGQSSLEFRKEQNGAFILVKEYPLIKASSVRKIVFDNTEWSSLFISRSGSKWIFSNFGLFKLDENSGEFREYKGAFPTEEFTGKHYFVWAWENDGIYVYNTSDKSILHINHDIVKQPFSVLPAPDKSVWFSNSTHMGVALGVTRAVVTPDYFHNNIFYDHDSLPPAIYAIVLDKDKNIWTGIRGYDHIVIFGDDNSIKKTNYLTAKQISEYGYIRSMIPVHDGIWIGYYNSRLEFYDYKTGKFIIHHNNNISYRAIAINKNSNIYIGTNRLSIYYPSSGNNDVLWNATGMEVIYRIYPDTNDIVWAGMTNSRLLKYNAKTEKAEIIMLPVGPANIEDIMPGENGDLWLALLGEGVARYNTVTGDFKIYNTSMGLSNNTTYGLLKDQSGNIWVSTNKGISRINMKSGRIRAFGQTDGLAVSEFNSGARFMSDDGEFLFGGMGGYVRFYPDTISQAETANKKHKILLTGLEVSGEPRYLEKSLNESDTILLRKGETNFHLIFSTTDFINADKTIFRYRLSGTNKKWIETTNFNRNINYTNLKPNWHTLWLEAKDIDGNWTIRKQITIRIPPFFFQTKLFLIIMPLVFIALILFLITIYIRQLKQKEMRKQDQLRLQTLRGQMNPHFIFNSLNSINFFISNNDKISANRYIGDFSRLIRSILANLDSNFIPFENEINSLNDYLRIEHLRFSDKFTYVLKYNEIKNIQDIEICPGIVQPFVENAIWHGVRVLENRKGFISITFTLDGDDRIKCIIEDDGAGRDAPHSNKGKSENHKSHGISLVRDRLQIMGKMDRTTYRLDIQDLDSNKTDKGTRVTVEIPARIIKKTRK